MRCARCNGPLDVGACTCTAFSPADGKERCAVCGTRARAASNFCSECGATFVGTRTDRAAERRQICVMFVDLVGSTRLAETLGLDGFHNAQSAYEAIVAAAVADVKGYAARKMGDGFLLYFGYPLAHEDDVERAVRTAVRIANESSAVRLPGHQRLRVRIGIAAGLVVVERKGDDPAEVAGRPANLAFRLQEIAGDAAIAVSPEIRESLGDLFEWRDLGQNDLKGFGPMQVWAVVGSRAVASRFDARRRRSSVPMLGRSEERRTLLDLWARARAGQGAIAVVTGEAGVGKSRLAAALLEDTAAECSATLRFFCAEFRQATTLHPCIQYIEHAAGFAPQDDGETRLAKLREALAACKEPEDFALIAELVGVTSHGIQLPNVTPSVRRRRTMRALLRAVERQVQGGPALIVFEDAQWSDPTTRELLELFSSRVARLPLLLVVLARPETGFEPAWDDDVPVTHIDLTPLETQASVELVHRLAGSRALSDQVVAAIVERTDGLPLYLEEVTEATLAGDASPAESAHPAQTELPFLLQSSLQSRLDRLGGTRRIAEIAAAIGRDFGRELIESVIEDASKIDKGLEELIEAGVVERRLDAYRFRHALIRDAAYSLMEGADRRGVHKRIADALEARFPGFRDSQPEILGHHYARADDLEQGLDCYSRATRRALERSAMLEALSHASAGLELSGRMTNPVTRLTSELQLTIFKGMAQIATQGYAKPETRATFTRARAVCAEMKDPPTVLPYLLAIMHGLWTHHLLRGDLDLARRQAEQVLARGVQSNDPLWLLMGHRFTGVTHHPLGEFEEATRRLELGLALYDPAHRESYRKLTVDDPRVVMLTYRSWSLMCLGRFADARRESEQAVSESREMNHAYSMAHALNGAAFVALTIDTPQAGLKRLDELAAVLADQGVAYYDAVEKLFRGYCLAGCGRFTEALSALEKGMADYRDTGSRMYLPGFLRMSAEAHVWAGRHTAAVDLVEEALTVMDVTDQRWDEPEIHRVHGMVLRAAGDLNGAEAAFRRALAIARRQNAGLWALRAGISLAELLAQTSAADEALTALAGIVEGLSPPADVPDVQRARNLLCARAPA